MGPINLHSAGQKYLSKYLHSWGEHQGDPIKAFFTNWATFGGG
jgi:hypothetical protein